MSNKNIERRISILSSHLEVKDPNQTELQIQETSAEVVRELLSRYTPSKREISFDEFKQSVGKELGTSEWFKITQDRVNAFADATGDHQWIHVDPERAAKESPFGGPIAHGFLTLSLISMLAEEVIPLVKGVKMGVNYGLNKVRFTAPVLIGSSIRTKITLNSLKEVGGGVEAVIGVSIERQNESKPAATIEWLVRYYF